MYPQHFHAVIVKPDGIQRTGGGQQYAIIQPYQKPAGERYGQTQPVAVNLGIPELQVLPVPPGQQLIDVNFFHTQNIVILFELPKAIAPV